MENDILSRIGFMTQSDKTDFEKRFEFLVDKTEKLEQNVSDLTSVISRLEKKLDVIFSNQNSVINGMSATVSEVKNNMRVFNQSERQLLNEISSKLSQQLKSQFDEIHYLQYNLQRTQQSAESIEKNCSQELDLITDIQNNISRTVEGNEKFLADVRLLFDAISAERLNKEDLKVVESFLRLIAANQMIQETYFES